MVTNVLPPFYGSHCISVTRKAEAAETRLGSLWFLVAPYINGPSCEGVDTPLNQIMRRRQSSVYICRITETCRVHGVTYMYRERQAGLYWLQRLH